MHRGRRTAASSTAARCGRCSPGSKPDWSRGRALLFQIGSNRTCGEIPAERGLNTFYDALRTKRYTYVELNRVNKETGVCDRPEYELYDLKADPFQLRNIAANPARRARRRRQPRRAWPRALHR